MAIQHIELTEKLRISNPKINANFAYLKDRQDQHEDSAAAHRAEHIPYSGEIEGADNTKEALDNLQTQLSLAIVEGDSGPAAEASRYNPYTGITHASLPARLNTEWQENATQLAETAAEVDAINAADAAVTKYYFKTSQSTPPKRGISTRSPKLIVKKSSTHFIIVQRKNRDYVFHEFKSGIGGNDSTDTGGAHDLLRWVKSKSAAICYLAKTTTSGTVGSTGTLYTPGANNAVENALFNLSGIVSGEAFSSNGANGIGVYSISSTSEDSSVSWSVLANKCKRGNVLILGSPGSTTQAELYVNGELVRTFDPTKFVVGGNNHYQLIEFDVPTLTNSTSHYEVKLVNKDHTGKPLYYSCCNFYELDRYPGADIDLYKVIVLDETYLEANGASDYAILDQETNRWVGSYHGGETRDYARITWTGDYSTKFDYDSRFAPKDPADPLILDGAFILSNAFEILQLTTLTTLNGKTAKMHSIMNFDEDGTINMTFSLYNNQIRAKTFFTALTSTYKNMGWVEHPYFEQLSNSVVSNVNMRLSEGYIRQLDAGKSIQMDIRFTKFDNYYAASTSYIYNDSNVYRKFYYGPIIDYAAGVVFPYLTFSKAVDFCKK